MVKNPLANAGRHKRCGFDPWVGTIPWRRAPATYSRQGNWSRLLVPSSLGWDNPLEEGTSNLLQFPCLENPMDIGAWGAMVHRVTNNQTQLK